jgi:lysophospholipase L1-like esterase
MKELLNYPENASCTSRKVPWAWKTYLVLIHMLLIVAVFKHHLIRSAEAYFFNPSIVTDYYKGMVAAQQAQIKSMPENCIVFIGDSITWALNVKSVSNGNVMNFGIPGDNTEGVLWRIPRYSNLKFARAIVLSVGVNDLQCFDDNRIASNYESILGSLPKVPVIASGVLPINEQIYLRGKINPFTETKLTNAKIKQINHKIKVLSRNFPNVTFIDAYDLMGDETGSLRREYTTDSIHLSSLGYTAWADFLKSHINETIDRVAARK